MEWTDDAILLSARRHGESGAVVSLLTWRHGRHAGLVRGGGGKAGRGALQPGNRLLVTWKARLAEQLGQVSWELLAASGAVWLDDPARLAGISSACALVELALAEREPHPASYEGLIGLLDSMGQEWWSSLYVHWEIGLLAELGYGLDLSACAATGATEDLAYVSPKTGRAVSRTAGEPYRDRLLPLPRFLLDRSAGTPAEIKAGLAITGHFLQRHLLEPGGRLLPPARQRLIGRLEG